MITTKSKINFSNLSVPPIIPVVQGDTGRVIQFELNDFTIPAGATATYYVQKPSGEAVYNEATISGNNVFVELTAQSIIEVGENYGQVRILVDEEVVTSFDFILIVKVFRGIDAVQSETEMNIFDKAVERAQETIASTVTEAEAAIEAAAQEAEEYIAQAIDPTLTITNKAADAKVVGDLIAAQFDPTKQYEMDEPCLHDGKLYVSRSDMYSAPGEWVPGDWKQIIIGDNLQELTAATKNITEIIAAPWNGGGIVVIPYEVGDYCTRNGQLWRCTVANESGTWIAADWQNVTVADEISNLKEALDVVETTKADKGGTVASAEQLLSDVGTEDKAPYLFRAVPYDSTRVDEEVVGCSVGWNQYASDAVSGYEVIASVASLTVSSGEFTLTSTSNSTGSAKRAGILSVPKNHVVLLACDYAGSGEDTCKAFFGFFSGANATLKSCTARAETTYASDALMYKMTNETDWCGIRISNGAPSGASGKFKNIQCIDLTAWFGSAIADYAYTLETATAGSGVAWIKALLPGGYIPYSAPKMESVRGLSGHKFTGFNWWDEVTEDGTWNTTTGAAETNTNNRRNKNPIHVLPNTAYYTNKVLFRFYYDADMNFVLYDGTGANSFTTPANACYMNVRQAKADWDGTNTSINLSDPAKNGTYEPYKATTYALDSDLTLRGILKMDSDHNVYADGDVYGSDGTVTRKYVEIDLGEQTWSYVNNSVFRANISSHPAKNDDYAGVANCIMSNGKYINSTWSAVFDHPSDSNLCYVVRCTNLSDGTTYIGIIDSSYSGDTTAFKSAMSGVKLVYEVLTSETEQADPYASPQNCEPGGTEEYVYAEGGSGVPVGHNSKYLADLKGELERVMVAVPDAPSSNGTYTLKATVASTGVTYSWVSD